MADFEKQVKQRLDRLPSKGVQQLHDGEYVDVGKRYKPDRVYRRRGHAWVVEIEGGTSRKDVIGGYLKAQKYFEDVHGGIGSLLFVIKNERKTLPSFGRQITEYHEWLRAKGLAVRSCYLLYVEDISAGVPLLSSKFLKSALVIP